MRAFIGIFFFGLVAFAAGTLGFQAGVASTVAAGTGNPSALWFLMGGPHFGGLFFLFFLFAIAMAIGGARRRHRMHGWAGGPTGGQSGHGPWNGHGPWGNRFADGDPRRSWMSEMHRQMHEAEAAKPETQSADTSSSTGNAAAG
jgi:hypothetical protein